jgi:hypothetical protein
VSTDIADRSRLGSLGRLPTELLLIVTSNLGVELPTQLGLESKSLSGMSRLRALNTVGLLCVLVKYTSTMLTLGVRPGKPLLTETSPASAISVSALLQMPTLVKVITVRRAHPLVLQQDHEVAKTRSSCLSALGTI